MKKSQLRQLIREEIEKVVNNSSLSDEEMYEVISSILYAYDEVDRDTQNAIEDFFSKYDVNNGQDTDSVVRDSINSSMSLRDAYNFANKYNLIKQI